MHIGTLIAIGVALLIIAWIIGTFNKLVALKNQVINSWKQIDVQLKRRHDLIPNLVETVKGAMNFEQTTLTRVIEARNRASLANGVAETAVRESALTGALRQLFALAENYPALKSNENVLKLQGELSMTENTIGSAREFYNNIATQLNIAEQSFPINIVAHVFGFKPAELFEIIDAGERELPRVDLNLKKGL